MTSKILKKIQKLTDEGKSQAWCNVKMKSCKGEEFTYITMVCSLFLHAKEEELFLSLGWEIDFMIIDFELLSDPIDWIHRGIEDTSNREKFGFIRTPTRYDFDKRNPDALCAGYKKYRRVVL